MKKFTTLVILFVLMGTAAYAQLKFSGEFRPRAEYRHGYRTPSDSAMAPAFFVDQRTRLNLDFASSGYTFKLVLQDIRTWGAVGQLNRADGFTSVHEAWADIMLSQNISLKAGRQEIIWDDHRIMGSVAWAQQARSHDAAVVKYEKEGMKLHVGGAFNQGGPGASTTFYPVGNYKTMQYVWFHKDFKDVLGLSLMVLNNGVQVSLNDRFGVPTWQDNYSQTMGAHVDFKKGDLSVGFNGFYQMGATATFPAMDIAAYLVGLDLKYKVGEKFKVGVGFEMQSGNDQTNTNPEYITTQHAFAPLYGTNHKFNGYMDYFYVGNHAGSVGLNDFFVSGKYTSGKTYVGLAVHAFMSGAPVLDTKELANTGGIQSMATMLGTEADLSFGFLLSEGVMLKGGYSQMFVTESMGILKGITDFEGTGRTSPMNNWGYVMVIIKPTFIKKK